MCKILRILMNYLLKKNILGNMKGFFKLLLKYFIKCNYTFTQLPAPSIETSAKPSRYRRSNTRTWSSCPRPRLPRTCRSCSGWRSSSTSCRRSRPSKKSSWRLRGSRCRRRMCWTACCCATSTRLLRDKVEVVNFQIFVLF